MLGKLRLAQQERETPLSQRLTLGGRGREPQRTMVLLTPPEPDDLELADLTPSPADVFAVTAATLQESE